VNYRHAFHAGNFADLVKHAALLRLMAEMTRGSPLTVIDTHAGRGLYDLAGAEAVRSGEARAGIGRLMAGQGATPEIMALKAAASALNGSDLARRYPGSPWLIAQALRPADRYIACELNPDEHAALADNFKSQPAVRTLCVDGFQSLASLAPAQTRVLALIDPPFERADDYVRIVEALRALRARNPAAVALVWLPLKDLETLDAFQRDLEEAVTGRILIAEARIRPLTNPMKMNGCALALIGGPDLVVAFTAICDWVAEALGEGGGARVYRLA
jgi:23S rRNA (adenine2030-N6)-methyltransferase